MKSDSTSSSSAAAAQLFALVIVAAMSLAAPATAQVVAWAWVVPSGQGQTFTPSALYQYCTNGETITVSRGSTDHEFVVQIPNAAPNVGGCIHATAFNGNHTAVVKSWLTSSGDVIARILLFDPSGQPANDAPFTIHWRHGGANERREAYCWANSPTTASYSPLAAYAWNGSRGQPVITRVSTGRYQVMFPGLGGLLLGERGHVQVSPHGSAPLRTTVASWAHGLSSMSIDVRCFDFDGQPTDGRFVVSYNQSAAPISAYDGSGAHVFADQPTAAYYTPSSPYTDSNGRYGPPNDETVRRLGPGVYRVNLPNVRPSISSTVQVTGHGPTAVNATVGSWVNDGCGGTNVTVETYDSAGAPVDSRFTLLYLTNRPAAKPVIGWAWINPGGQGQSFQASSTYSYSSVGQPITVTRGILAHQFYVTFHGCGRVAGGVPIVTAQNGNHVAIVGSFDTTFPNATVYVETYDENGNQAPNANFHILWQQGGEHGKRTAYAYAWQVSTPNYPVHPIWAWNERGGAFVTRTSTGVFEVLFPGLAAPGSERGNVQVTPIGGLHRVKVASWANSGSDLVVHVHTRDLGGALTDAQFVVSYTERAAPIPHEDGSGAHVWANLPTIASYTPHPDFTDSNGTLGPAGGESITRIATGYYRVSLPNLKHETSALPFVSGHGSDSTYATVHGWVGGTGSGTDVYVTTWDAAGSPADARFTLLYLTDEPAVTPAQNTHAGSSCNGIEIEARTRPVLCRDWDLALTGVPSNTALGFVQLDLISNPTILGNNAPGCVVHTGGAATVLLVPPIPDPAYSLTIPSDPSFLGVTIYAQGGALVPGVNPYSLALSGLVGGVIGDY